MQFLFLLKVLLSLSFCKNYDKMPTELKLGNLTHDHFLEEKLGPEPRKFKVSGFKV